MSGGRFDYKDLALKEEIFGCSEKFSNVFEDREISKLVWDVLELIHEFDWYSSGDTSEERYLEAKTAFKKKWFNTPPEERISRIIDETIEDVRAELKKTYCTKTKKSGGRKNVQG